METAGDGTLPRGEEMTAGVADPVLSTGFATADAVPPVTSSKAAMLNWSPVGSRVPKRRLVDFAATAVRWTHIVSPAGDSSWETITCRGSSERRTAPSQSFPTPHTTLGRLALTSMDAAPLPEAAKPRPTEAPLNAASVARPWNDP